MKNCEDSKSRDMSVCQEQGQKQILDYCDLQAHSSIALKKGITTDWVQKHLQKSLSVNTLQVKAPSLKKEAIREHDPEK